MFSSKRVSHCPGSVSPPGPSSRVLGAWLSLRSHTKQWLLTLFQWCCHVFLTCSRWTMNRSRGMERPWIGGWCGCWYWGWRLEVNSTAVFPFCLYFKYLISDRLRDLFHQTFYGPQKAKFECILSNEDIQIINEMNWGLNVKKTNKQNNKRTKKLLHFVFFSTAERHGCFILHFYVSLRECLSESTCWIITLSGSSNRRWQILPPYFMSGWIDVPTVSHVSAVLTVSCHKSLSFSIF